MIRISRNETGKAKVHLELNLVEKVKDNKKGYFKYINNKMKTKDNMGPLLNVGESLVTEDAKKAGLLNTSFALVFTKTSPLTQETREGMLKRRLSLGQGGLGQRTPTQIRHL